MVKNMLHKVVLLVTLPILWPIGDVLAESSPAGYWQGAIRLPNAELNIQVSLQKSEAWTGTISIPAQGLKEMALSNVVVTQPEVSFVMANVPGNPTFRGKLSADSQTIEGEFSQGGATFPFRLARRSQAELRTEASKAADRRLVSTWQGALKAGPMELRLVLKILEAPDGTLSGTFDSIDQGAKDIEVSSISLTDTHLEMSVVGASFKGRLNPEQSVATGEWRQGGQAIPLVLRKTNQPSELRRPQEPKPPFPYREEEVSYQNGQDDVRLAGSLTFPKSGGPFPAVILISGSGAQDRNEAIMGHKPFLVLADYLTRKGVAVLRVDDRGVGGSTGRTDTSTLENLTGDVLAGVNYLKSRKEVHSRKIGLIGHSEGGIVAPLAATRSSDIAFIVLMAGTALPGEQILYRQAELLGRAAGMTEEEIAGNRRVQERIFEILKANPDRTSAEPLIREAVATMVTALTDERKKELGMSPAFVDMQVDMTLSPWFRFFLTYDPRPALRKITAPVLAINGVLDLQVPAEDNLQAIAEALREAGNSNYRTMALPNLNHLFQTAKTGSIAEYSMIEETIAPSVLTLIADWILRQTE